jgi:glutaredoxin
MRGLISRLLLRPPRPASALRVTLYGRHGCSCCDKALALLRRYQQSHAFALQEVDVDSDPALAERHGLSVPVVEVDGRVRFRGVVNPALFERLLAAAGRDDATAGEPPA